MKSRIFVLAMCVMVLSGCDSGAEAGYSETPKALVKTEAKPDFAGVSFNTKKSDFERDGYVCKASTKDGETLTKCKNFDAKALVFGQDVKGVSVSFREGQKTPFTIDTDFPAEYAQFAKRNGLVMRINEYYTSLPEQDMSSESVELKRWKRSDGAVLQLIAFSGIPGIMEPNISIQMFSVEESSKIK